MSATPTLRRPSAELQAWIRAAAAAMEATDELGDWPRRIGRDRGALLIHASAGGAYVYYVQPDGVVVRLDTDDLLQHLDEAGGGEAVNAVAQGAVRYAALRELLPERPAGAAPCPRCAGTGRETGWGPCACDGLGWIDAAV